MSWQNRQERRILLLNGSKGNYTILQNETRQDYYKKTKGMKQVYFINNGKDNFLKDFGVIIN